VSSYTIKDLEAAQARLDLLNGKWDSYSGNNPDKYRSDIHAAARECERVERALKENGALAWSTQELLENGLDKALPDARNKQVVEYRGNRYQRRWIPVERGNSGLVSRWQGYWVDLDDTAS